MLFLLKVKKLVVQRTMSPTTLMKVSGGYEMSSSVAQAIMTGETSGNLTVIFHECEEGGYTAECIELPGCFSEGDTQEDAERNIREAMDACLSVIFEDCLERLRVNVDLGRVNMSRVSKQETFNVQIPRLQVPEYAI